MESMRSLIVSSASGWMDHERWFRAPVSALVNYALDANLREKWMVPTMTCKKATRFTMWMFPFQGFQMGALDAHSGWLKHSTASTHAPPSWWKEPMDHWCLLSWNWSLWGTSWTFSRWWLPRFCPRFLSIHNFFPLERAMFGGLQKKKIFFSAQLKRALKKSWKPLPVKILSN